MDWAATPVLIGVVAWLSVIDLREFRLPDSGTLPLILAGLGLGAWRVGGLPADHIIGALVGYGLFAMIGAVCYRATGRDALGLGDAKLLAAAGAWLGWSALPTVVLFAAVTGLVFAALRAGSTEAIPFGPALGLSIVLHWSIFLLA